MSESSAWKKIEDIEKNLNNIENDDSSQQKLVEIQNQLNNIESKVISLDTEIDKILESIEEQRWFFFQNKPNVLMDRNTGILWANLDTFEWYSVAFPPCRCASDYSGYNKDEAKNFHSHSGAIDGFDDWKVPDSDDFVYMIEDTTFPFQKGANYRIKNCPNWFCYKNDKYIRTIDLDTLNIVAKYDKVFLLPCNFSLVKDSDYAIKVSSDNKMYNKKEKLRITLDLFLQNELFPIFDDSEMTQLYKKVYACSLSKKIQELQLRIKSVQTTAVAKLPTKKSITTDFNYTSLIAEYDIKSINNSVIKFYTAIQKWIDELMNKLNSYEEAKADVIRDFNDIGLKLAQNYVKNNNLTDEENNLLAKRQQCFQAKFALGMNTVKAKLLLIKQQADDLEYRLDEIDNSNNSLHELALLEAEVRPSFALVAENTAKIIKNALQKINYFEAHRDYVKNVITIWEMWTESYKVFKTTYREELRNSCENESIEAEIWEKWYNDWQSLRFEIEEKIQPLILYGLKSEIPLVGGNKNNAVECLIKQLDSYKKDVDNFYLTERKGIYQEYAFQTGGELQEKFDAENQLYKLTFKFQSSLQDIIFKCKNVEDRIFILNWVDSLLDIRIDEILQFVADNDLQEISREVLNQLATLKQKNYDAYLTDVKAYSKAKSLREQQYNSLIFKMRKDLMKKS